MAESELAVSDSKVNELNRELTLMKEAERESVKLHKAEMARAYEVVTACHSVVMCGLSDTRCR